MSADDAHVAAFANLRETYLSLARAAPCQETIDKPGLTVCLGDFPHPICNFAIVKEATNADARLLRGFAEARKAFHVYVCTAQPSRPLERSLEAVGFTRVHTLVEMASTHPGEGRILATPAANVEDRRAIARFMMAQFFSRHPDAIRARVCEATATAAGLDLYAFRRERSVMGALMLCPLAETLGLYNLCIAGPYRGRGHGTAIVRAAQGEATARGVPVVLQCNEELAPWYASLGFQEIGTIRILSFPQTG